MDVKSDHHMIVCKVCIRYGRYFSAQDEEVKTVLKFERLKYKGYGEEFRKRLWKSDLCESMWIRGREMRGEFLRKPC